MTKSQNTKRALLASVLSMMLCIAMLVGSTFAWFTDSVTSGKNKIVAGNLDVELNWSTDGSTWERVNEDTDMFKGTLWEPGYTRVVYLQVENAGSLALKYKFGINVADKVLGETVDGKSIDLSNFIKFGVVETENAYTPDDAGRTAAREAVKDSAVLVSAGYDSEEKNLSAKTTSNTIALVVYMPEEVGNDANYGTGKTQPSIDLGINLVATQYAEEFDSFGKNYDENAEYDGEVSSADSLIVAFNKGGTYKLAENIELTEAVSIPEGVEVVLNLGEHTVSNENGYAIVNNGNLTIDGSNGSVAGLGGIRSDAGKLTINGGNFNGSSDWKAGTYQHTLRAENCEVVINGGTFDATVNGQTNAMIGLYSNATVTINGGTFKNVDGALSRFDPYLFNYADDAKLIINDGTFYGGWRFNFAATTDIYGGDFTVTYDGQSFQSGNLHVLTVYGGNFTPVTGVASSLANKLPDIVAEGYSIVNNADGTKTVVFE